MSEAYLQEWIRKAEEDYTAATVLARRRKHPTPSVVCFHCQQCAEKYLKLDDQVFDDRFCLSHKVR
jgi:HEPN domain-containing protein